ncbi:MAG: alpha/beta hydrolase [bacterium]|nr:alpha/beta hydrolase [bacterium]
MPKKPQEAKKKLIIVHCWEGHPEGSWYPWLKAEMEKRGWEVLVPAMPNTNQPEQSRWLPYLQTVVGKVDRSTFMVGHSLGCITILRFLERLPEEESIGGTILVAGFDNPLKYKELKNFFQEAIAWKEIKKKCSKFTTIHSQDDPYVPVENSARFKENLGAKTIVVNGYRHFSGDDGVSSVPLILEKLLEISK